ncbi:hypothetical protein E4Z66_03420 [Aliishimia ponticola]|uniref:Adenylate/guanylate cyclase domain-containing protein n=1 Tax=Aliishimia ponticola TaxID=2499833 RepID=A0A4S4NG63_9RHOB|nr:adenylate/guanylate cyclase domain-containing protein [Aliishimia ponticola]THH38632.1 hypothetical protein E4Z66_03420 [Aliishimia ponticola]
MDSGANALAEFLEQHGLERYAGMLAEQAVDLEVLPQLTVDELREIGLPVGDRRKLMTAVSDLLRKRNRNGGHAQARSAERRHVTILFCDMVGSTELAHRLDPEDFSELLRGYSDRSAEAIRNFKGYVAKFMGDGVLAFFGYPKAHEDDVERAILAARDIQRIHAENPIRLEGGAPEWIKVRIGIHTGKVVVGSFKDGQGPDEDIFGEAPNVAQRLLSAAKAGEIVISPHTRQLAGSRFEYAALEPRVLRGLAESITPYRVVGENTDRTRFESRRSDVLTPFVGRVHDVERLVEHWAEARQRRGQTVLLSGPAGIGKSRLANAFFNEAHFDSKFLLTFQSSQHHTGTALYPVIARLRQEIGLTPGDEPDTQFEKLRLWMADLRLNDGRSLALMAALLSVDIEGFVTPLDMTPRQRMEETLLLLVSLFDALSQRGAILAFFEDVHWADPTTKRLIDLLQEHCATRALLVIVTFRSDAEQGEPQLGIATHYRLDRLTNTDTSALVIEAAKPVDIPPSTIAAIVQRAQGVPLFAEELTKAVMERLARGEAPETDAQTGELLVPDSLVDSLSARLDALPEARHLAQVAAAIGREVPQGLLRQVSGYDDDRFKGALKELSDAQLIHSLPEGGSEPLVFGHALIQDVAYGLMLRKDRRRIHGRIVKVMEDGSVDGPVALPEILARHCEAARQTQKAVTYLIEAGRNAIAQSANAEALRHLKQARALVAAGDRIDPAEAARLELEIQSAIGIPLIAVEGYTSRETVRAFDRAEEIAASIGDVQSRFQALFGLWGHRWMAGHLDMSQRIAAEMLEIAEAHPTAERQILANRCAGSTQWIMGNCAPMLTYLDRVIDLTRDQNTAELASKYAVCPQVVALVLGGYEQWLDGAREAGLARLEAGRDRAYRMSHPYSQSLTHSLLGGIGWLIRDETMLEEHTTRLRRIADDRRFPYWQVYAQMLEGALLAMKGDSAAGREALELSIHAYDRMGVFIHRTVQLIMLSEVEYQDGNTRLAAGLLDEAEALGNRTGERQWFGVIDDLRQSRGQAPN